MQATRLLTLIAALAFSSLAQAGEFGDHCTTSLAGGVLVKTPCLSSTVFEGKIYCFGNEASKKAFDYSGDKPGIIARAAENYARLAQPATDKASEASSAN